MTRWFLRVTRRHHASGVPERADAFAKAGRCRVRLESPDSESDLSPWWKAIDQKASGVPPNFRQSKVESTAQACGTAKAKEESGACREAGLRRAVAPLDGRGTAGYGPAKAGRCVGKKLG